MEKIRQLHGYTSFHLIGEGGMGQVYRCWDPQLERHVALKLLSQNRERTERERQRFYSEMRTLATLRHDSIVNIHFGNDVDGSFPYFVMDFIEGKTLRSLIENRRQSGLSPLSLSEVCQILRPVARALDYLHGGEVTIVHGDVKPANLIFKEQDGGTVLVDFGVSVYSGSASRGDGGGTISGTRSFMAPELFDPNPSYGERDGKSDNYSLALIAYEMLTLNRLSDEYPALVWEGSQRPLPHNFEVGLDVRTVQVLSKALSPNPLQRHDSAELFIDDLENCTRKEKKEVSQHLLGVVTVLSLVGAGFIAWPLFSASGDSWPKKQQELVENFPVLLPEREHGNGWMDSRCMVGKNEGGEEARIECYGKDDIAFAVANYSTEANRAFNVQHEVPDILMHDDCSVDVVTLRGQEYPAYILLPGGEKSNLAVLLSGPEADSIKKEMPLC